MSSKGPPDPNGPRSLTALRPSHRRIEPGIGASWLARSALGHRRAVSTVVVTGAAGSIGQRVVSSLAADPEVGRVVGVDVVEAALPSIVDTRVIDISLGPDVLGAVLAEVGADSLVNLAWDGSEGERGAELNHLIVRNVLAASSSGGLSGLVHLSSGAVYGAWPDNPVPLSESAPLRPNPELDFAVVKAETERMVADWAEEHPEVSVAVLRPAPTLGSSERPLPHVLARPSGPGLGDGSRRVQFLHADDLATAVVTASRLGLRGAYNVAPDAGIEESVARVLAGGAARVSLPGRAGAALAGAAWLLWGKGVPRAARAYATHPWVIAPDRLKAEGWAPSYTSEEALVATDGRLHWDDLPPGRRQNAVLAAATLTVGVAALGGVAAWRRVRAGVSPTLEVGPPLSPTCGAGARRPGRRSSRRGLARSARAAS